METQWEEELVHSDDTWESQSEKKKVQRAAQKAVKMVDKMGASSASRMAVLWGCPEVDETVATKVVSKVERKDALKAAVKELSLVALRVASRVASMVD